MEHYIQNLDRIYKEVVEIKCQQGILTPQLWCQQHNRMHEFLPRETHSSCAMFIGLNVFKGEKGSMLVWHSLKSLKQS